MSRMAAAYDQAGSKHESLSQHTSRSKRTGEFAGLDEESDQERQPCVGIRKKKPQRPEKKHKLAGQSFVPEAARGNLISGEDNTEGDASIGQGVGPEQDSTGYLGDDMDEDNDQMIGGDMESNTSLPPADQVSDEEDDDTESDVPMAPTDQESEGDDEDAEVDPPVLIHCPECEKDITAEITEHYQVLYDDVAEVATTEKIDATIGELVDAHVEEVEELDNQITELEIMNEEQEERIEKLQKELIDSQDAEGNCFKAVNDLKTRYSDLETELENTKEKAQAKIDQDKTDHDAEVEELKGTISGLEADHTAYREGTSRTMNRLGWLINNIMNLSPQGEEFKSLPASVQSFLGNTMAWHADSETLRNLPSGYLQLISAGQNALSNQSVMVPTSYQSSAAALLAVQSELDNLRLEKDIVDRQLLSMAGERDSDRSNLYNLRREKGVIDTQLLSMTGERDSERSEANNLRREKGVIDIQLLSMTGERDSERSEANNLRREKGIVDRQLLAVTGERDSERLELTQLRGDKAGVDVELNTMTTSRDDFRDQLTDMTTTKTDIESTLAGKETELKITKDKVEELSSEVDSYKFNFEEKLGIASADKDAESKEAIAKLKKQVLELEKTAQDSVAAADKADSEMKAVEESLKEKTFLVDDLEQAYALLEANLPKRPTVWEAFNARNQRKKSERAFLNKQRDAYLLEQSVAADKALKDRLKIEISANQAHKDRLEVDIAALEVRQLKLDPVEKSKSPVAHFPSQDAERALGTAKHTTVEEEDEKSFLVISTQPTEGALVEEIVPVECVSEESQTSQESQSTTSLNHSCSMEEVKDESYHVKSLQPLQGSLLDQVSVYINEESLNPTWMPSDSVVRDPSASFKVWKRVWTRAMRTAQREFREREALLFREEVLHDLGVDPLVLLDVVQTEILAFDVEEKVARQRAVVESARQVEWRNSWLLASADIERITKLAQDKAAEAGRSKAEASRAFKKTALKVFSWTMTCATLLYGAVEIGAVMGAAIPAYRGLLAADFSRG